MCVCVRVSVRACVCVCVGCDASGKSSQTADKANSCVLLSALLSTVCLLDSSAACQCSLDALRFQLDLPFHAIGISELSMKPFFGILMVD